MSTRTGLRIPPEMTARVKCGLRVGRHHPLMHRDKMESFFDVPAPGFDRRTFISDRHSESSQTSLDTLNKRLQMFRFPGGRVARAGAQRRPC